MIGYHKNSYICANVNNFNKRILFRTWLLKKPWLLKPKRPFLLLPCNVHRQRGSTLLWSLEPEVQAATVWAWGFAVILVEAGRSEAPCWALDFYLGSPCHACWLCITDAKSRVGGEGVQRRGLSGWVSNTNVGPHTPSLTFHWILQGAGWRSSSFLFLISSLWNA